MAGALFDAQWLVTSNRHPRDAGRSQVVERDPLVAQVAKEELRALDARDEQMLAEQHGAVFVVRQPKDAGGARVVLGALGVEALQQRSELGFDGNATRLTRLRALHFARSSVDGLRDVDDAMLEIDIVPGEGLELAGPRKRVGRRRVEDTEAMGDQRSTLR